MKKIILFVFLIFYCKEKENIIKEYTNPNSKIGFLKIKIINSPYEFGLANSRMSLRGLRELPEKITDSYIFEKNPSFIIQGEMKDNLEKTISLEEGNYFAELSVNDSFILPLLISDLSGTKVVYGFDSKLLKKDSEFFSFKSERVYSKNDLKVCEIKEKYILDPENNCPVIHIEEGKITEIKISFDDNYFNYKTTGAFWLSTLGRQFPAILLGTIIISRDVKHEIETKK